MQKNNVLIMGDSYSTFAGYIPEGYGPYYPENDKWKTDVLDVSQTWWHQVVSAMGANLVRNDSWSGAPICYTGYDNADVSKSSSFIYRLRKLKEDGFFAQNQIHTVFVFGGTNDSWCGASLGQPMESGWEETDLYNVLPAISCYLQELKQTLPEAKIYCLINNNLQPEIEDALKAACGRQGIKSILFDQIDKENDHPTAQGMRDIKDQVLAAIAGK